MDEQNDQNNPPSMPAEIPPAYAPSETPPSVQPEPLSVDQIVTPPHREPNKKLLVLIVSILIGLVLLIGLSWAYILYTRSMQPGKEAQTSRQTNQAVAAFSQPDQVVYYSGGSSTPATVYAQSVQSKVETKAITLPPKNTIARDSKVLKDNLVAFVTVPQEYGAEDKSAIYYSEDAGKSYKKIYTAEHGAAITSLVFSSDKKSLVAGVLLAAGKDNKVTEISLEADNKTTTLFTTDNSGVFLKGYDRAKQKALYFSGCYNCDGTMFHTLYEYDIAAKKQHTFYTSDNDMLLSTEVNRDFTKVLFLEGRMGEAYNVSTAPYTLFTIAVNTNAKEIIKTFTDTNETLTQAGYTSTDNPFIANYHQINEMKSDGTMKTVFKTSATDMYVNPLFVSTDGAIGAVTTAKRGTVGPIYNIMHSDATSGDTTATDLMKENHENIYLGVTLK